VSQSLNGQSASEGNLPKNRGTYTGERLKSLRPATYREVVRLLAEPREHVSIREICRRCHVTDDTVKAIEEREAVPIAARKQELMAQAARIAQRAADRVEDEIGDAPLPQAVVTFGVMTDKIVALSNDPMQIQVSHQVSQTHLGQNLYRRLDELAARLTQPRTLETDAVQPLTAQPALLNGETILNSGR
jgi:hypothetical protein